MPRSRLPGMLGRLALAAVSLVVTLIVAEVALRVAGFEYALYPQRIEFGWPDPVTLRTDFRSHERMLWVPPRYDERVERARNERPNLLLMGDSCTALGEFDRDLETRVRARWPELEFRLANFAVSGWSSYQGLQQLESDVLAIRPDVVTLYFGWNDHWASFGFEDKRVASMNASWLYGLRDLHLVQLTMRAYLGATGLSESERPARVSPEDFGHNLETMVARAQEHGVVPVLITAPSSHRRGHEPTYLVDRWLLSLEDLVPLHQRYVSIVREVARSGDVALCDLEKSFASLPESDRQQSFTGDGLHFTPKGNVLAADFLFDCLTRGGLIGPGAPQRPALPPNAPGGAG